MIHEISRSLEIHRTKGTILGGVHLELTGEVNDEGYSVTECIGGSMELEDKDLSLNYRTHCDPRLNYEQSLGEWMGGCGGVGMGLGNSGIVC